jgi:hypothetical protein
MFPDYELPVTAIDENCQLGLPLIVSDVAFR